MTFECVKKYGKRMENGPEGLLLSKAMAAT
jgi:hypothetical protein